jgi:hypothetical protein
VLWQGPNDFCASVIVRELGRNLSRENFFEMFWCLKVIPHTKQPIQLTSQLILGVAVWLNTATPKEEVDWKDTRCCGFANYSIVSGMVNGYISCTSTIQGDAKMRAASTANQAQFKISIAFPSLWQVTPGVYIWTLVARVLDLRLSDEMLLQEKGSEKNRNLKVVYINCSQ